MIYTDQYRIINQLVDSVINKSSSVASFLWIEHAGHRAVMYHAIVLLNYYLFNYNTLAESYLSCFILIAFIVIVNNHIATRPGDNNRSKPSSYGVTHAMIALLVVSWISSGLISWSIGVVIFAKSLVMVLYCILVDRLIREGKELGSMDYTKIGVMSLLLVFLLGGYLYAFLPAFILSLLALYLSARNGTHLKLAIFISFTSLLAFALYSSESANQARTLPINALPQIAEFICILFGNAILMNADFVPLIVYKTVGIAIVFSLLVVVVLTLRKNELNLLGTTLVLYALCVSLVIAIGRTVPFGPEYGLQPRYIPESQLGIVGAFLLAPKVLIASPRKAMRVCTYTIYAAVALFLIIGIIREMRIGPYRKAYMETLIQSARQLLFTNNSLTPQQITAFNAGSLDEVEKAMQNCVIHGLSAFSCSNIYGDTIYVNGSNLSLSDGFVITAGSFTIASNAKHRPSAVLIEKSAHGDEWQGIIPLYINELPSADRTPYNQPSVSVLEDNGLWRKTRVTFAQPHPIKSDPRFKVGVIQDVGLKLTHY
jgi:hypothetical protein